jgi:hypothetical protein
MEIQPLPTSEILQQKEMFITFLQSNNIGSCTLEWKFNEQRMYLQVERREREPGAYYRDPYPLFLTVSNPRITFPLTQKDVCSLISALQ